MGFFVIACIDRPNSRDLRLATRPDHLEFLAGESCVLIGGPFLDANGEMIGSLLVIEAENLEDAKAFAARDPYARAGLFETSFLRPWRQTAGSRILQEA